MKTNPFEKNVMPIRALLLVLLPSVCLSCCPHGPHHHMGYSQLLLRATEVDGPPIPPEFLPVVAAQIDGSRHEYVVSVEWQVQSHSDLRIVRREYTDRDVWISVTTARAKGGEVYSILTSRFYASDESLADLSSWAADCVRAAANYQSTRDAGFSGRHTWVFESRDGVAINVQFPLINHGLGTIEAAMGWSYDDLPELLRSESPIDIQPLASIEKALDHVLYLVDLMVVANDELSRRPPSRNR